MIVSSRYERASVLVTSKLATGEWGNVFGDPVVATAILGRLLHYTVIAENRLDAKRKQYEAALANSGWLPDRSRLSILQAALAASVLLP